MRLEVCAIFDARKRVRPLKPITSYTTVVLGLAATAIVTVIAGPRAFQARAVRQAFQEWETGEGSIYDLMDDDVEIAIPGTARHCGTYRKDVFLREVAGPFAARFATPPLPRLRKLWASADDVTVMADATGVTRDGQAYANTYVFIFEMTGRRVRRVVEFLDMTAFNAVWDGVSPAPARVVASQ